MQSELMRNILSNKILFPEISILFIIITTLLIGVFSKKNRVSFLSYLSAGLLIIPLIFLYDLGSFHYLHYSINLNDIYYIDSVTIVFKALCIFATIITLLMLGSVKNTSNSEYQFELPTLLLSSLLGMLVMASCNNLLVMYMGIELQTLCLYILAASRRDNTRSTEAGLKYFILSVLASGLLLYGISLVYTFTGTISFSALSSLYNNEFIDIHNVPIAILIGLILILVAFFFKISAVPFHMWTPDVYEGSPTIFTAFFSSAPKIAALCLIIRMFDFIFSRWHEYMNQIFIFVAVITMLIGALAAVKQNKIKRLLAYSSIGHMGFVLLGFVANNTLGNQSILLYIMIYAIMTLGTFACIIMIEENTAHFENIHDLAGLSKSNPYLAAIIAILMFSMAGIPPLAGFFAKFAILKTIINSGYVMLATITVVISVVSAYYYLNIVKIMYFDQDNQNLVVQPSLGLSAIASLMAAINLLFILMQNSFGKILNFAFYEIH
ncbi:MAG: NADH-quinone oxidoreductase subunit N [Sphingobacteriia bacterium]|nr:NADH-quinone oxidoreductase subunit N [Sphingobacteriia bacterium]